MPTTIRLACAADAPRLAAIYAPHVTEGVASFELQAPDAATMARRVADTQARWPWLVWQADGGAPGAAGEVLGYAYAGAHAERAAYQWSVNVSVYVDATARRRGVGRALYAVLLEMLRRQGAVTALAGITVPNAGSLGLHRAMGFEPVACFPRVGFKHGAWHDVTWLARQIPAALPAGTPAPPWALPEALTAGVFEGLLDG